MRGKTLGVIAVVVLGAAAVGYLLLNRASEPPPPMAEVVIPPLPAKPVTPPSVPAPPAEPAIAHPVETEPVTDPLPELGDSDAPILKALATVLGKKWQELILPERLIHRIVATVDNLPRKRLPASIVPVKRVTGAFAVVGSAETLAIDAKNPERYASYVQLIKSVDTSKLVAVYRQFYPLFQRAYVELGYPNAYFNDRLVEALDDLLAAPEPEEPIRLAQPKVLYEFADPALESRSAGQKIMIRMGRDNAVSIKSKLREIRQNVARGQGAS